ncbi:solute carrier family 2, facilitated glucose transporter member 6 [Polypterus senegalus]
MGDNQPLLSSGRRQYGTVPETEKKTSTSNKWLYLAVFSAVLGNFNFGYSMVYPSSVIPQMQNSPNPNLKLNIDQISWFGSIFTLGAASGGLSSMLLNDRLGRKLWIMLSAIPSVVGYAIMAAAQNFWMLLLGRFLTGVAGGITASSIPVYVSEISNPKLRGRLGSCPQMTAVFGSLALYALGLALPWRWLAVAGEVPALIMLILLCFMPESPRFLISKNKGEEAEQSLVWLRGKTSDYMREYRSIERSLNLQGKLSWSELQNPRVYKPILISVGMRFLQQMTGITPILVYLEPIFKQTKVILPAQFDAALVGAVRLISVTISASCMDKAGRKILLFVSSILMFLSTLSMGLYTDLIQSHYNASLVDMSSVVNSTQSDVLYGVKNPLTLIPLISTMVIIFGYAMGWGPITWLLMSEILPLNARGVASGLCVLVSWVTAFILTQLFMKVVDAYGLFVPFFFFTAVCFMNFIFTAVCVPETKGRSLEEIENYFRTGRKFTIIESHADAASPS